MLKVKIPEIELYDERTNTFSTGGGQVITLEHSLVSLSKWESKWKKPFMVKGERSLAEIKDYIRCMTITQNVDENVYNFIDGRTLDTIREYIEDPHTATTVTNRSNKINNRIITSEVIYYWMIALNIPMECQKWHLNRLLTLINVCNEENRPDKKKMSRQEIMARNSALNAERKARLNTRG